MNRGNLAKLLCKYCDEPVPTAIFISAIYRGLASHQRDYELEQRLSARRKELAVFATDILDLSVKDQATDRVDEVLNERFQDFGLRTPIQMAYDSNNKCRHNCISIMSRGMRICFGAGGSWLIQAARFG